MTAILPEEKSVMSPIIIRLRTVMVALGDLPDVEADASMGLSNGAILERLQEMSHSQSEADDNAPAEDVDG